MRHKASKDKGREHVSPMARCNDALRRYFITGLAALLPVVVTIGLVFWFDKKLRNLLGVHVPGLGLVVTFAVILAVGVIMVHLFGKAIIRMIEVWFGRLPIVRKLYPAIKQLTQFIFSDMDVGHRKEQFRRVVIIEYPRSGSYALGFVTNEMDATIGGSMQKMATVLIPQPPSPVTGPVVFVPEKDVVPVDMSVEDAVKLIMSGGVVASGLKMTQPLKHS